MNIYENYDGNDINDATFMVESFVEELQLREKLSPKLKALAAAGLIGLSSLGAASCSMPNDPTAYETPAEEETKTPADDETSDDTGTNGIDDDFGFDDTDDTGADDIDDDNTADDTGNDEDDLTPDTDPDAGDEGGAGSNTDATADWPAPKFVFSDEGYAFKPLRATVKYRENSSEDGFKLDGAIIAVPTVDSDGNVIFFNMSDRVLEDSGLRIGNIDTKNPYIIFKDGQICSGDDECYILYDDLKAACDKAKVKMNTELFLNLNDQLDDYSYAD